MNKIHPFLGNIFEKVPNKTKKYITNSIVINEHS